MSTEKEKHLGGYWNIRDLWGDPATWSPEILNKIIKDFNIKSIADIGCGLGFSTKYFAKKGLYVVGVEGGTNAIHNSVYEGPLIQNDYTKSSAFNNEEFDLIWCCEFVEHVEEQFMNNFLHDFKNGKYIAMTHAIPGQDGWYHVNCQYEKYWINHIEKIGFSYKEDYSKELRTIAEKTHNDPIKNLRHGNYLRKTLLFFEKDI